jgi:general secretion pathway protein D
MSLSPRRNSTMAPSFSIPKGFALFACLTIFLAGLAVSVQAQDSGPISNSSSNFQKVGINSILDLYETLSGKHLIRDAQLDGMFVSFNATNLTKPETVKMIESTLLLNGVAIVQVDDHTSKVVTIGGNKNPRAEGLRLYANAVDLPTDDQIIMYYMPFNYINPDEAAGIFQAAIPPHQYGGYVPAHSAQAVVITENVSVVRQLIALKELIDAPPARVSSEWIQLNRADAEKVADIVNKMLGVTATGAPAAPGVNTGGGPVVVPASLGNAEPLSNERNLISGPAQVIPDPRSNKLLVITRPVNLPFLEQMIGQLDQSDIFLTPVRYPLKYVLAQDILGALEEALAVGKDEEDQAKKDAQAASGQSGAAGAANGQGRQTTQPTASTGGSSSSSSGSANSITPALSTPTENDVPTVVSIGKTKLMADNRSNSIIIFGSPDSVSRVTNMIDQLDRKPLQVYLATVIGQLTVTEGEEFGIDILQKFQSIGQGGIASSNLNNANSIGTAGKSFLPEPASLTSAGGFPLPTGLTLYGAIGSTLNAYVHALETTDRFKIISRPSVYTLNNKLAIIANGSQVPVPQSTTSGFTGSTTDDGLTTTSSIAYQQVLLDLEIIPLINADHEVTLKIRQTNNSLGANVDISGNEVPTIETQEINTEVTVPNKSTVVIGGLIKDNTSRDASGLPWLSDIPILQYLFSDTNKTKERDELIIMIQPSVVETDADQLAVNEEEKQRTILGREAVEAAVKTPHDESMNPTLPFLEPAPLVQPISTTTETTYNSKNGVSTKTTTTTNTLPRNPTSVMTPLGPTTPTGPVPALSSPAPDVTRGKLPKANPPAPMPTAP